jgi:hypothetical protein
VYVSGADAGFCNFEQVDVLGWLSGASSRSYFDAFFVAGLLVISARHAGAEAIEPLGSTYAIGRSHHDPSTTFHRRRPA